VGHNKFSTMTEEEIEKHTGFIPSKPKDNSNKVYKTLELADTDSVDWRDHNAVTPIQDQGSCGGCWAFSCVAATEGAASIKSKTLTKLSEEQLIQCTGVGCSQGVYEFHTTFDYLKQHALASESAYPWTSGSGFTGWCHKDKIEGATVQVTDYTEVTPKSKDQMKAAVAVNPVTTAIHGTWVGFTGYVSGIIASDLCGSRQNHAVTLVGFGVENGHEYFIIKNSWGTGWGEKGYARLLAVGDGDGMCGIYVQPIYPTVTVT